MGSAGSVDENYLNSYANKKNLSALKLHLGCGGQRLPGWINIDNFDYEDGDSSRSGASYDIKMDIRNLSVLDGTVDQILLVHVLEHFVRWETIAMLRHFFKKLREGGVLIVEMPDFRECIRLYLDPSTPRMRTKIGDINIGKTQFFGNQWDMLDYETQRYVWEIDEFVNELSSIGFNVVSASHDAKFHVKGRDMFVIAQK